MRHRSIRILEILVIATALAALADCTMGSEGIEGNLLFFDLTRKPGDPLNLSQTMNRPVAEGASIDIEIKDNQRLEAVITSASSSNEAVLTVQNTLRNVAQLAAEGTGNAFLEVTAGGQSDSIALSVSAIASSEIDILPWGEVFLLPASVYAGGVAMTPDSNTSLFLRHRNANDQVLTGYGARALSVEPAGATLTPTDGSDFFTLKAMNETGTVTVSTDDAQEQIEVLELSAIVSVTLNDVSANGLVVPSSFSAPVGSRWYTLGAYTEDGRFVIAPFDDTFEVDIEEDSMIHLELVEVTSEQGSYLLEDSRAFFLDFKLEGTAYFTVRWLDFELPFSVLITAEETE
ncbi:MAG: hypothetical protein JW797_16940 [Bradymonadales bacterium]|nr:hypothetical protein [Bradymonadales bacterium]